MSQVQPDWYNKDKANFKGSVILAEFNKKRQQEREAAAKPKETAQRMYAGAMSDRLTSNWAALNTSADSEIVTSIRPLRARARQLVRDNEYAKNAVRIIENNVIGGGIGMQAQVSTASGKLIDSINARIEESWEEWCDKSICHVSGLLGFQDMERTIIGMLATDGEVLIRKVREPFGDSNTPFALEIIESDRLVDQWSTAFAPNGNMIRMGVEMDKWMRPVAYWLYPNHPGDMQFASVFVASRFIRVPAEEIIHLYIIDRWPQTRGVSWFHTSISGLSDIGGYEEAEIVKARATASVVGFIRAPEPLAPDAVQAGQRVRNFEPGTIEQLLPGEEFQGFNPSSPNPAMDPFLRYMLRRTAAGIGLSYESLSRDYSQSNYSSSRLALLDDRDLWRVLQGFVVRNFRQPIHRAWMQAAVMGGDLSIPDFYTNKTKYQKVRFKPRGWSWIDPSKEVLAYKMAVRCGFMTVGDVIARTADGADLEDIMKARKQELEMMEELEMVLDTDPAQVNDKGIAQPTLAPQADAVAGADEVPAAAAAGTESTAQAETSDEEESQDNSDNQT
jgi:lambda family phage portal protein